jgi:hypothetical protein
VTLKQGKYLTVCSNKLFTLLQECSEIENADRSEKDSMDINAKHVDLYLRINMVSLGKIISSVTMKMFYLKDLIMNGTEK